MKKILGVDYGKKRVGLASGDTETGIAFPKDVIENKGADFVIKEILNFCDKWGTEKIVVGLPLNMDLEDVDNEMMRDVRKFVEKLKEVIGIEVELFDERLSSFEAEGLMKEAGQSTKDQKMHKDAIAAQIILQRYFDSL